MFANPETHECLLLLVLPKLPLFASTWLPILTQQEAMRPTVMFDKNICFQMKVTMVKKKKK
jgi:hypothetical protein